MKEYTQTKQEVMKALCTNAAKGLSCEQAENSRKLHGGNTLTKKKPESAIKRLWRAVAEPMTLLLVLAGVITIVVNIIQGASGLETNYFECIGIFAAILLSVSITVAMEGKSAKAFEALSTLTDNTPVRAIRGGNAVMIDRSEIVVGDILTLSAGDKIPADGRLLESVELSVDESALTGESEPVLKNAEFIAENEKTPLAMRANMLYSGSFITFGSCKAVVTAVGDSTEFGKIAGELTGAKQASTPLQEKLASLGKVITLLGVAAATVVFIAQLVSLPALTASGVMQAFITAIVLIVAAVPEGLPTIVAVSLSLNVVKLAKQNALVKKMIASETIGCVNVICSDKTGTLTENKMTVSGFYGATLEKNTPEYLTAPLIHNICLNSTADVGDNGEFIGNPTECALLNFHSLRGTSGSYKTEREAYQRLRTFPFSSQQKHMITVAGICEKAVAYVKGSPERVISMCDLSEDEKTKLQQKLTGEQQKAQRIIAFAHKELPEELDLEDDALRQKLQSGMTFDGFAAISDPLRADVYSAVKSCRGAGVDLKILTGDNIVTAKAIAEELGLFENGGVALTGIEIEEMSDSELCAALPEIRVIARSTPATKLRVVGLLKSLGNVVAVTGDGINDAPALKNADVGIAMGISGTQVSKEAGDVVLLDDSFSTIVKAIGWGRNIYENFKRFITFQLTVNFSSVAVVVTAVLLGLKAPFTALQLLWINIIMDGPPALTLGLERGSEDLMSRRPTGRSESIVSKVMFGRIAATGIYISGVFLLQYLFNFLGAPQAQELTVLFTLFVLFQLFNAFNCRELHTAGIFKKFFSNKPMLLVMGCTFVLQVLIIQFAGAFFGTVPLSLIMWIKLFAVASSVVLFSELVKFVIRRVAAAKRRK